MDEQVVEESKLLPLHKRGKDFGLLSGLMLLIIIFFGGVLFAYNSTRQTKLPDAIKSENKFIANGSIVYGYWRDGKSIISAYDLSIDKIAELAVLPSNVKNIKVLSNNTFFYISETDIYDYGKKLVKRTIDTKDEEVVFQSDSGFGIDDYVVSPNGKLAAIWVVGVPDDSTTFIGNKSRVYTLDLSNNETNLIYDEISSSSVPIHYPVGITNAGEVFLDTFLPNTGAGWAYGMSTSVFDGSVKKDIEGMSNGTYSTQPVMSPDGNYLAFAGHSGKDGAEKVQTFRKALISPNTVEILSTFDKTRTKLNVDIDNAIYPVVGWDSLSGKLIISSTQNSGGIKSDQYIYEISVGRMDKVEEEISESAFVGFLQDNSMLFGERSPSDSGGNLGPAYASSFSKMNLLINEVVVPVNFNQLPLQFIALLPGSYFDIFSTNNEALTVEDGQKLQLKTFEIKPPLVPVRENRQNNPVPVPSETPTTEEPPQCRTIVYPQCNALLGTNYSIGVDLGDIKPRDTAFEDCFWSQTTGLQAKNACAGSPLYLYGETGTKVNVTINTEISNPNVEITDNHLEAILTDDGKINISNKIIPSLSFDYVPKRKKIVRPDYGYVVRKERLRNVLEEISYEFGFNAKETSDVLKFGNEIGKDYVFVSFFNNEVSKSILPIYFYPNPETYRNIVFYFEGMDERPDKLPREPEIEPIRRSGFTAIELSYLIR